MAEARSPHSQHTYIHTHVTSTMYMFKSPSFTIHSRLYRCAQHAVSGLSLQPTCIWCTHALSLSILPVHRHTSTGNEVHAAILKGTCVCYRSWLNPALHTCTLHLYNHTSQHNTCCYKYSMHTHMWVLYMYCTCTSGCAWRGYSARHRVHTLCVPVSSL